MSHKFTRPFASVDLPCLLLDLAAMSLGPSHQFRNQCDMMILDGSFLGGKKNIYM
jgi:hypothetical protein